LLPRLHPPAPRAGDAGPADHPRRRRRPGADPLLGALRPRPHARRLRPAPPRRLFSRPALWLAALGDRLHPGRHHLPRRLQPVHPPPDPDLLLMLLARLPDVVRLIDLALAEDLGRGDVTTEAVIGDGSEPLRAALVAREELVVFGLE